MLFTYVLFLENLTDPMAQMPTSGPMHAGAMNPQRMMSSQAAGMQQMRGVNQPGPRMTQPGMRNS